MNGKALCDKHFGMTEERLKLEQVIKQIFSEIDWIHSDCFGLIDKHCNDNLKSFEFTVPNYLFRISYSHNNEKIQKILFNNGYVKSDEAKQTTRTINGTSAFICENPLFVALELMDNVVIEEFNKNGISFTKFKGNTCTDPYFTITISQAAMEKL